MIFVILDKTYRLFKDDFVLKIMIAHKNAETENAEKVRESLNDLIKTHGIATKLDSSDTLDGQARKIHQKAAIFSTTKIVEKIEKFAAESNKKVLYVLSFPGNSVAEYITDGIRFDEDFIPFLEENGLPYVDLLEEHARDFKKHSLGIEEYVEKYFIGHYNPLGNYFCANALQAKLLQMLDPKPLPYQ